MSSHGTVVDVFLPGAPVRPLSPLLAFHWMVFLGTLKIHTGLGTFSPPYLKLTGIVCCLDICVGRQENQKRTDRDIGTKKLGQGGSRALKGTHQHPVG